MSEITPNTPNPVREDAYVEELSEKLGIDPQYIPKSPVWRNEEEIRAIAEMFANMSGGGGSSGGGVLVVHETVTTSEGATIYTLDKTWQEIHDADFAVLKTGVGNETIYYAGVVGVEDGAYYVGFMYNHPAEDGYDCDSASGYPSYTRGK